MGALKWCSRSISKCTHIHQIQSLLLGTKKLIQHAKSFFPSFDKTWSMYNLYICADCFQLIWGLLLFLPSNDCARFFVYYDNRKLIIKPNRQHFIICKSCILSRVCFSADDAKVYIVSGFTARHINFYVYIPFDFDGIDLH